MSRAASALADLLEAEAARLLDLAAQVRELDLKDDRAKLTGSVELLDPSEVAERLRLPRATVCRLDQKGRAD